MQVVTVANAHPRESYYCFNEFKASLQRFGIEPVILGWGEPWKGLGRKPALLKQAIESGIITSDSIAYVDAFDVVFSRDPSGCGSKDKIIFGAEKNCFPDLKLADKFPETNSPYRYLNCGFSIGPTELYLQALKEMKADELPVDFKSPDGSWTHFEDQRPWQMQYLYGNTPIGLDTNHEIVWNTYGATMDEIDLNNLPVCVHFNGSGKTNGTREPILKHLGL